MLNHLRERSIVPAKRSIQSFECSIGHVIRSIRIPIRS